MLHAVIMAGGSGTRFWPASTEAKPKQFLAMFGEHTMLQNTVDRIQQLVPRERIWVITNEKYVELTANQLPDIPQENIIGEPAAKDTAPCVGAASALIAQKDEDAAMAVLPADHLIKDNEAFISVLGQAKQKARQADALVTLGIKPRHPETGYGYIEFNKEDKTSEGEPKEVAQFCEKPDKETAQRFVGAENFLWNSGMFVWKVSTIQKQFEKHLPGIYEQVTALQANKGSQQEALKKFYQACPSVSVDYGIMEKARNVFVVPAAFGWNDVGDWKAFYELNEKNKAGNAVNTDLSVVADAQDTLIESQSGKIIAVAGVDNVAVVETDQAILVCDLNNAQKVKQVVNQMRDNEELKDFL